MRRHAILWVTAVVMVGVVGWWLLRGDPRSRAERAHGIRLPPSAWNIQCKGDAWVPLLDRGAATLFEMSTNDLAVFLGQLHVRSRSTPVLTTGDPTVNGYNVWPTNSPTFVPGNAQYGGFRRTWRGDASPVEMLSCSSPKGDWLHTELWRLESGAFLVKMYTDWN